MTSRFSPTALIAATVAASALMSHDPAAACDRVAVRAFAARAVTVVPLQFAASAVALGDTSCCGSAVAAAVAPQVAPLTVTPLAIAPLAVVPLYAEPLYAEPLAVPVQVHATKVRAARTAMVRPQVVRPARVRSVTRVRTSVR